MATKEMVQVYINQLCTEIGCTPESIYSKENNCWMFSRGSAFIEVFLSSYETAQNTTRTFVRCFSAIYPLPADDHSKQMLYEEALQNNSRFMGVKLSTLPEKGYMYAVAERDIDGMDYAEFKTLISDLGYWADQLDDLLYQRFSNTAPVQA